jgi:hypothetical protein
MLGPRGKKGRTGGKGKMGPQGKRGVPGKNVMVSAEMGHCIGNVIDAVTGLPIGGATVYVPIHSFMWQVPRSIAADMQVVHAWRPTNC